MKPPVFPLLALALAAEVSLTPEALAAAPRYKMVLEAGQAEQGVQTVSLVGSPAIQRGWVALEAVEPTVAKRFHFSEVGQKQVVTGPALIPGQEILRLTAEKTPFFIQFDAATIEATQRQFCAQLRHTSTNQDHAIPLDGNTVIENWIITDPTCDKATALGLTGLVAGTWMLSIHIADPEYWQNEVVSGNKTGFSIEGFYSTEQLTLSAVKPAPTPFMAGLLQKLGSIWATLTGEQRVALGMAQLADGRTVQIDDASGAVTVPGADGAAGSPLPDGSYQLADGGELVVVGGMRKGTETPAGGTDLGTDKPGAVAAPAPLAADAGLPEVVAAVNELIKGVKPAAPAKAAENPATTPAAPKLAAALDKVALADLGPKLTELKLDSIDLEGGGKLVYNPITRQLRDDKGALVESGWFAAADGSYFSVDTDQYIWEISKSTYDSVYKANLEAVQLKAQLASTPAARAVVLNTDGTPVQMHNQEGGELLPHQVFLHSVRVANNKAAA